MSESIETRWKRFVWWHRGHFRLAAYLLMALVVTTGFLDSERQDRELKVEQEQIERVLVYQCGQAEERRQQIGDLTSAVAALGRDLTASGGQAKDPSLRREELLRRLDKFEQEQLEALRNTKPCPPNLKELTE